MTSSRYEMVPFLQAVRDCTGGNYKVQRREYETEGEVPVIDQGQDFIAGYTAVENSYQGALPVVLFGDHTRAFKYVDFSFALGADGVKALEPLQGFTARFLHYYFLFVQLPNAGYSRHFKFLKEISVPKPSIEEQHSIVDILSRAQGIVRLRHDAEKKTAELIPALFLDMFGDPTTNPKGWPMVAFGTVGECRLGKMLDKQKQSGNFQLPYLRNINVQWNRIDTYDLLTMDFHPDEQSKFRLQAGDIMICEGGEVGRAAIWNGHLDECYYQKALHRLRPNLEMVRPDFIVWLLWHLARTGTLLGASTHATIAHLTGIQLKSMKVICPTIALQQQFEQLAERCKSIQLQQSDASAKAQATFEALLSQVFSNNKEK